jgi:hypothetical protein
MSDTEGMTRVMEHAAENLRLNINKLAAQTTHSGAMETLFHSALVSMSYARAVLQLVAASVSPEGRTITAGLVAGLTDDGDAGYGAWAEANDGISMSDAELASVARFLSTFGGAVDLPGRAS